MYPVYINRVLKDLTNRGFEVLYIGAFGSFNYGLETENSDYDMKAIINNSIDDVLLHTYDSKQFNYSFGECEIINLIEFGNKLSEFQLPYLEILFSKFYYANKVFDFEQLRNIVNVALVNNRKKLAYKFLSTMKKIYNSFIQSDIFDFNGKKTYNIIRLYNLFKKFNRTKKYDESLKMEEDLDILYNHKLNKISKAEACKDCITYISKMNMFIGINYSEDPMKIRMIKNLIVETYSSLLRNQILKQKKYTCDLKIDKSGQSMNCKPLIIKKDVGVDNAIIYLNSNSNVDKVYNNENKKVVYVVVCILSITMILTSLIEKFL